ncbi:hypothetical protein ABZZ47_42855, partial [Streptomyces sp. NPDC006465]|uniref:hypothetical protein n=1 Tax=Streptomyces sp. NPDC006465 TaxID=3157174 RepID=UPI0033B97DD9
MQNPQDGPSPTPIYDALHAEWVRSFRTLPGDRHGEEELGFKAFGSLGSGSNSYSSSGSYNSYSSYSAGAQTARQIAAQHGQTSTATAVWQPGATCSSTRLASHMMRICSETTVEGSIWPVDANLRPEG